MKPCCTHQRPRTCAGVTLCFAAISTTDGSSKALPSRSARYACILTPFSSKNCARHAMARDGTRWRAMARDVTRWHAMARDGARWHAMARDGTRWRAMAHEHDAP
eukprot:7172757-Prymnesium_polylepis.1